MDLSAIIGGIALAALALLLLGAGYFLLYRRYLNKALSRRGEQHLRLPAPYRVAAVLLAALALGAVLALALQPRPALTTPASLAEYTREALEDGWSVEVDASGTLAAVLAYSGDRSGHTFALYENTGGSYIFRYGGSSTSIARGLRAFSHQGALALFSLNELHIANIECHSGERYAVDPNAPFVLVIPDGGFEVYDAGGRKIDLADTNWYEETELA